jgi:hypothetical protein
MSTTALTSPPTAQRSAPIPAQSFLVLVRTELRKALDVRSARIIVGLIMLIGLGGIIFRIVKASDGR